MTSLREAATALLAAKPAYRPDTEHEAILRAALDAEPPGRGDLRAKLGRLVWVSGQLALAEDDELKAEGERIIHELMAMWEARPAGYSTSSDPSPSVKAESDRRTAEMLAMWSDR